MVDDHRHNVFARGYLDDPNPTELTVLERCVDGFLDEARQHRRIVCHHH